VDSLASFNTHRLIVFADAMPRKPGGEILKTELGRMYGGD